MKLRYIVFFLILQIWIIKIFKILQNNKVWMLFDALNICQERR